MATYQNDFKVKNSLVVRNTATISNLDNIQTISYDIASQPTINLNFLNGSLDTRITFSRASGATYVGSNGIVQYASVNQPRFDYSPSSTGTIRGLLIEEQRTNLIPYSQDQTQWAMNAAPNNYLPTANAAIAPDGTASATFILKPVASGNSTIYKTWAGSTSTNYIGSIWLKAGGYSRAAVVFTNSAFANIGTGVTVNLSTGAIISVSNSSTVSVTSYANNWYRVSITALSSSTTGNYVFAFYPLDNSNNATFAGDGVSGIYSWGAQVETSQYGTTWPENFVTSYIPTLASQVTRSGEDAKIAGQAITGVWNQNNGTLFAEWMEGIQGSATVLSGSTGVACFTNPLYGYNGYGIQISTNSNQGDVVNDQGRNQSNYSRVSTWPYIGTYINAGQIYKSVVAWDSKLTYGMTDGLVPSGTGGPIATTDNTVVYNNFIQPCNTLQIGSQNIGGVPDLHLNGWVRRIQWWPSTLSAARIQALTTSTSFPDRDFASSSIVKTGVATTANFVVKQGVVVGNNFEAPDIDKFYITNLTKPTQQASLNLNFLRGVLDPRISFTRASGATVIGPDGFIKYVGNNVPRFNYSTTSTGTCLGLLIEEQRTNYMLNTNGAAYGVLAKNSGSATGPDGKLAHKFTVNASTATSFPSIAYGGTYSFTGATGTVVTVAFTGYFGPGFGSQILEPHIVIQFSVGGASAVYNEVQINTTNWTIRQNSFNTSITQVTAPTITPAPGGMYKVSYVVKYTDDGTLRNLMSTYLQIRDTSQSGIYATNGDSGVQYACMQTEVGQYPTSYIPTETVAVTRISEYASISGNNFTPWFNQSAGTWFAEFDTIWNGSASLTTDDNGVLAINDSNYIAVVTSYNGHAIITRNNTTSIPVRYATRDGKTVLPGSPAIGANLGSYITANTIYKAAASYSSNLLELSANNVYVSSTDTTSGKLVFNRLDIGYQRTGGAPSQLGGHIRKIAYYPERLASTVTQSLTVI